MPLRAASYRVGVTNKAAKGRRVKLVNGLVQGYMEEWNAGIPKRAVEVNRKERKERIENGVLLNPGRQLGCHPAGEPKSQGNEPHSLVFVFFAFFAVNLDCSFQDSAIPPFRIPLHQSVPEPNCLEFGSCLTAKNAKNA